MDTNQRIIELLKIIGQGKMSNLSYDTAWIARLGEIDYELSNHALAWLSENQLSDGSWGAATPNYYHDRIISTLAAMLALMRRGRRSHDRKQIEDGLLALDRITRGATRGLQADPNGATVGFEMIAPTLVEEAEALGIIKQQKDRILGQHSRMRTKKLEMLKGLKINRHLTHAFSSEMAGSDGQHILDIDNLQEINGSVGNSPSATAYYALSLRRGDVKALAYLKKHIDLDGGAPNVAPFDIFEPAWVLWNLSLLNQPDEKLLDLYKPHLDKLLANWQPGKGIGHASEYTPKDSDDSALVYELLSRFGYPVDIGSVLSYEEEAYFRCFSLEANPSTSANIHVLGALKSAGFDSKHPSISKVLNFLRNNRIDKRFWFDKWHASPYYPTSHAIIAAHGLDEELCLDAMSWIVETQNPDGSWGYYQKPTGEETAYCLQALLYWEKKGEKVLRRRIDMGLAWLIENQTPPYPPLWIGKGLYSPEHVVQSAILSVLN
jgi:halimadienyl-diphosphate synthase